MSFSLIDIPYYFLYVVVISLFWGMGRLYYIPIILDAAFNICLEAGGLSGWDIRIVILVYGLAFFTWVLVLAGAMNKSLIVLLLVIDFTSIFQSLRPQLVAIGEGTQFWTMTSTTILMTWMISVLLVVLSVVFRSTIVAKFRGEFVDLLTNPRKRFLLPIGLHSAIITIPPFFKSYIPTVVYDRRFDLAAWSLLLGWIALELPHFIMYQRLKRRPT